MSPFNAHTHTHICKCVCVCVFDGISACCIIATPQDGLMDSETMKQPVCLSASLPYNLSIFSSLSCVSQAEEALTSSLRTHSALTHPVAAHDGNV